MHPLTFTFKRAHWASMRLLEPLAARHLLTPARFDLLYVLHLSRYKAPWQFWVAQQLGVSRPTICKMIKSMRAAGLVALSLDPKYRFRKRISLTRDGRKCFARLFKMFRRRRIAGPVEGAWRHAHLSRDELFENLCEIIARSQRYSRGLDEYTVLYPIHLLSRRRPRARLAASSIANRSALVASRPTADARLQGFSRPT